LCKIFGDPVYHSAKAERRSAIEHELFEITDEIEEAMERARIDNKNRYPDIDVTNQSEEKNNFRAYDQAQSFFITVTKDKSLDSGHPAAIIDTIIERLDLKNLYNSGCLLTSKKRNH